MEFTYILLKNSRSKHFNHQGPQQVAHFFFYSEHWLTWYGNLSPRHKMFIYYSNILYYLDIFSPSFLHYNKLIKKKKPECYFEVSVAG